jgi:hypothetical protein
MKKLWGLTFSLIAIAMMNGCTETVTETVYQDAYEKTTIKVAGIAQWYHVRYNDAIVQSSYVDGFDILDTITLAVPKTDSVFVGAENLRGTQWQWVTVKEDSVYRFKVK